MTIEDAVKTTKNLLIKQGYNIIEEKTSKETKIFYHTKGENKAILFKKDIIEIYSTPPKSIEKELNNIASRYNFEFRNWDLW
jgi:hypothetical protein